MKERKELEKYKCKVLYQTKTKVVTIYKLKKKMKLALFRKHIFKQI